MSNNNRTYEWRRFAVNGLLAAVALAALTWLCLRAGLDLATTAFAYWLLIVLTALRRDGGASIVLSVVAAGCLGYFFAAINPTRWIGDRPEASLMIAFLTASLVTAVVLGRSRRRAEAADGARKALEAAFRESQTFNDQLRIVIDTIPAMIWAARLDGSAEYLNRRWLEYTGLSLDQARDWGWIAAIHPEDIDHLLVSWRAMLASGAADEAEARMRRADGTYRWYLFRAVPLRDQSGRVVKWCGTNTDIEHRRQTEIALRAAIDSIPAIVWTSRPDGSNDFHNQRLLSYTKLSPEELGGDGWMKMFHPDDLAAYGEKWRIAVTTGTSFESEGRLRRFDGEYRWFLARAEPLRDKRGNVVKWYGTNIDIDDRKQAEQALRENDQRLRDYAETASDWIWESGPDHRFTHVTDRLTVIDMEPAPTIGRRRWDLAACIEDEPEKWCRHKAMLDAHQPFRGFTYTIARKDGSVRYVSVSGKPVFDDRGRFMGYRGVGTDVTAAVRADQAEKALQQARAELSHVTRVTTLGGLAASIAHEVNQPLSAIVANGEAALRWLAGETPDRHEAQCAVEQIIADGHRASAVIRRTRELSRRTKPEKLRLDINDMINDAMLLVQREAVSNRISLRLELESGLAAVCGDRVQLQQVIINLVVNGIEAMATATGTQRDLLVRSHRHNGDQVLVAVQDRGAGIDPENADKVFNAFFTTKPTGMGMGLSICRSIIEAHGGQLWASRNIGPGTTFQFTLGADLRRSGAA